MTHPLINKKYRGIVSFAILLVVIEKVAWIVEPAVFGNLIDGMIDALSKPPKGSPVHPLLIWIGVFAVNSGVGAFRRSRDERVYLTMYSDIAANIALSARERRDPTSKAVARAELFREYITFFQYRLPEIIEQSIDVFGAMIALAFLDWRLSATCLAVAVPLLFIRRINREKIGILQRQLHDKREGVHDVFASGDPEQIRRHYSDLAGWQQKIANWGALNFGIVRVFLLGIFIVILYIAIDLDDFTTGNIYSIAAYVWTFVTSSEYLPEQMDSWTSLKDISHRFSVEGV